MVELITRHVNRLKMDAVVPIRIVPTILQNVLTIQIVLITILPRVLLAVPVGLLAVEEVQEVEPAEEDVLTINKNPIHESPNNLYPIGM